MTRKNYNDIAERWGIRLGQIQRHAGSGTEATGFWEAIHEYCDHAKADNNNFDRAKFCSTVQEIANRI